MVFSGAGIELVIASRHEETFLIVQLRMIMYASCTFS